MKALISDIKRFAVHDGDGIRTTIFFKGCPLKCIWCHNPESISFKPQIAFYKNKCIGCGECKKEDFTPEDCLVDAKILYGKEVTVEELLPLPLEDRDFYESSGGGVTLSGGECLCQSDFCATLLERLKENGINTAVDTSGSMILIANAMYWAAIGILTVVTMVSLVSITPVPVSTVSQSWPSFGTSTETATPQVDIIDDCTEITIEKIKRRKDDYYEYWRADPVAYGSGKGEYTYVATFGLKFEAAKSYVMTGVSVFAKDKKAAKRLEKAVGGKTKRDYKHKDEAGYYCHFHAVRKKGKQRVGGHIFYL